MEDGGQGRPNVAESEAGEERDARKEIVTIATQLPPITTLRLPSYLPKPRRAGEGARRHGLNIASHPSPKNERYYQ